jgi:hypothetical protein
MPHADFDGACDCQADNVFEEATKNSGQQLWPLTWTVIDSFCPALRDELEPIVRRNNLPSKPADAPLASPADSDASAGTAGASGDAAAAGSEGVRVEAQAASESESQ